MSAHYSHRFCYAPCWIICRFYVFFGLNELQPDECRDAQGAHCTSRSTKQILVFFFASCDDLTVCEDHLHLLNCAIKETIFETTALASRPRVATTDCDTRELHDYRWN